MTHFSWMQFIPGVGHEYVHVATAIVATIVLTVFAIVGRLCLGSGEKAVVPSGRFSIKGIWEVIIEFIAAIVDMVIGDHGKKYVPLFCAVFVYVFFNNIVGLIPGMVPATDNINTTVSVGLFIFLIYNAFGVKEHGLSYFKHFLGPVLWLAPLMIVIELISHFVRPMSLGLRLAGNMTGDHTVLGIFLDLVPIGVPIIFYGMGLFVSFVQAFVFTLLSMVYVSMATAHDH